MSMKDIIDSNNKLGVKTSFFSEDNGIFGYTENGTIYLNEFYDVDFKMVNKHELLHLFEESKQFLAIKKIIYQALEKSELEKLRNQYYLKYNLLYSEEEIANGAIDNEIVIDMIISNGNFPIQIHDYIKDPYQLILDQKQSINLTAKGKKYLSFIVNKNMQNRFQGLRKWELFFANEYYKGKEKPKGKDRLDTIFVDAMNASDKLLNLSYKDFEISIDNNPYLIRRLQEKISVCKAKGEIEKANELETNSKKYLKELADQISENLWQQYCDATSSSLLYDLSKYDDSFRYLILNEMLTKTYRYENGHRIVEIRDPHKTLLPLIMINEYVLKYMYEHVDNYSSFTDLYFDALEKYNDEFLNSGEMNFSKTELGYWIKFSARAEGSLALEKDAKNLGYLVRDTPWCTKKDPKLWIVNNREFCVFVDHYNRPHIAIALDGGEIEEVRGIKGGADQEIEDEYRGIAIEFLKNNSYIYKSSEWLSKEERNQRLYIYLQKLKNKTITDEEIIQLVEDLNQNEINRHADVNSNEREIIKLIDSDEELKFRIQKVSKEAKKVLTIIKNIECNKRILEYCHALENGGLLPQHIKQLHEDIKYNFTDPKYIANKSNLIELLNTKDNLYKNILAKKLKCKPEEIYIGNLVLAEYCLQNGDKKIPYKYIIGHLFMGFSSDIDLSDLRAVHGDLFAANANNINLGALRKVYGSLDVSCAENISMPFLAEVRKDLTAFRTDVEFPSLKSVGGNVDLKSYFVDYLDSIETVGGNLILSDDLKRMKKLKEVNGTIRFSKNATTTIDLPNLNGFGRFVDAPMYIKNGFVYDNKTNRYLKNNPIR